MENISIHPPLEGEWKFLRPPGHHRYAADFVQLDENRKSFHDQNRLRFYMSRISSHSFFCWDKPVFAPVDGKVFRIGNGWKDHEFTNIWKMITLWYDATFKFRPKEVNGRLDIRPNAGNYVMIQAKEGYIVFLAHLRNHSICLSEGDNVRRGDIVGRVGNSGNSAMPHLHLNLFDQMDDPYKANVLPFVFTKYNTLSDEGRWVEKKTSLPRAGGFVRLYV